MGLRLCHDPSAAHAACSGRDDSWFRVRLLGRRRGAEVGTQKSGRRAEGLGHLNRANIFATISPLRAAEGAALRSR